MNRIPVSALAALLSLSSIQARADQAQCNSAEVAGRAVGRLAPGSIMLSFCSLCDSNVEVVKVSSVQVVKDCDHEVKVDGTVLAESTAVFKDGKGVENAQYRPADKPFSSTVDLAYVYVETAPNDFRWLAGELRLKDVTTNTARITLPQATYDATGSHAVPRAVERAPRPTADAVKAVWAGYFNGQGNPPLLVEAVACLEVDTRKDSPTAFECVKRVEGPVKVGTTVNLWSSWFLAQGDAYDDAVVQFIHNNQVRTTKDIKLKGSSLRARHYAASTLNKPGRWMLSVSRGSEELENIVVEVEPGDPPAPRK